MVFVVATALSFRFRVRCCSRTSIWTARSLPRCLTRKSLRFCDSRRDAICVLPFFFRARSKRIDARPPSKRGLALDGAILFLMAAWASVPRTFPENIFVSMPRRPRSIFAKS